MDGAQSLASEAATQVDLPFVSHSVVSDTHDYLGEVGQLAVSRALEQLAAPNPTLLCRDAACQANVPFIASDLRRPAADVREATCVL